MSVDFREEVERGRGRSRGMYLDMVQNPSSRLSSNRYSSVVVLTLVYRKVILQRRDRIEVERWIIRTREVVS